MRASPTKKPSPSNRLRLRVTKRALHLSTFDRLAAHMEFEAAAQSHMIRGGEE